METLYHEIRRSTQEIEKQKDFGFRTSLDSYLARSEEPLLPLSKPQQILRKSIGTTSADVTFYDYNGEKENRSESYSQSFGLSRASAPSRFILQNMNV